MSVTRRRFLSGSALSLAAVPLADLVRPEDLDAAEQAARQTAPVFRHGVASGDPRADRVLIWTRVSGGSGEVPGRWLRMRRSPASSRAARRAPAPPATSR
jgi:alkaline phosphatase D